MACLSFQEQNDDIIPDDKKYLDFLDILLVAKVRGEIVLYLRIMC